MRIKVVNTGNYNATYSALYVDSYYKKRADGKYVQTDFTPKQIKDYKQSKPSVIASNLVYYFDIIALMKYDNSQTTEHGEIQSEQCYKLYLLGDGESIDLGKGSFIIPVKFYSSNSKVVVVYISVFWEGSTLSTESSVFDFKMCNEKEFKQIVK